MSLILTIILTTILSITLTLKYPWWIASSIYLPDFYRIPRACFSGTEKHAQNADTLMNWFQGIRQLFVRIMNVMVMETEWEEVVFKTEGARSGQNNATRTGDS